MKNLFFLALLVTMSFVAYSDLPYPIVIRKGGTNATTKTAAFDNLSPTTTKGDISAHNGTNNVRLAVGTNGQTIVADSTQAAGIKWAAVGTGSSQTFTGSGTYNVPTGVTNVIVCGHGGGGGGGAGAGFAGVSYPEGGGGGGGAATTCLPVSVTPLAAVTVTIGSGGAGGAGVGSSATGNNGSQGGTSSFGSVNFLGGNPGRGGEIYASSLCFSGTSWADTSNFVYDLTFYGAPTGGGGRGGIPPRCLVTASSFSNGVRSAFAGGGAAGTGSSGAPGAGGGAGDGAGGNGGAGNGSANAGAAGTDGSGGGGGSSPGSAVTSGAGGAGGDGKIVVYWEG